MNEDIKNIIPGEGLGVIKFGMTEGQIVKILGEPNEKEKINDPNFPGEESVAWHYDELEISLGFENIEGWKLMNIALSSPEFEFHRRKLIGMDKEKLLITLDKLGLTEFLLDETMADDEESQTVIHSKETAVNFFLDNGILSEIMWSPIIDDEENFIFPN